MVYAQHTDVVRSLELLPAVDETMLVRDVQPETTPPLYLDEQLFASTSNDGTVRIWSLDPRRSPTVGNGGEPLRILRGHTSLVYDVAAFSHVDDDGSTSLRSRLVSSGEDGTVRVWDWVAGQLLSTIRVPVISVWCIAVLPRSGDVVIGSSDALVRVYSSRPVVHEDADSAFLGPVLSVDEVQQQAAHASDIHHSLDSAQRATIQAVDPMTDTNAGNKEIHDGQEYDAVLRIDVSDDSEPLPLPINRQDDRRAAAAAFIERHSLPQSYLDDIVNFINLVMQ
jgi:phospholipase A-2-activating protein